MRGVRPPIGEGSPRKGTASTDVGKVIWGGTGTEPSLYQESRTGEASQQPKTVGSPKGTSRAKDQRTCESQTI
jgi:hypothetical protein